MDQANTASVERREQAAAAPAPAPEGPPAKQARLLPGVMIAAVAASALAVPTLARLAGIGRSEKVTITLQDRLALDATEANVTSSGHDAVSQTIMELHDASQRTAKAAHTPPVVDLRSLSASAGRLVSRVERTADAADAARGTHAARAAGPLRAEVERADGVGRPGPANPAL